MSDIIAATTAPVTAAPVTTGQRMKNIFGGSIGNLIEWYDFYIYNSFAIYFAKSFTDSKDPTAQFLQVFGIYAIGFFIGPWVALCWATTRTGLGAGRHSP